MPQQNEQRPAVTGPEVEERRKGLPQFVKAGLGVGDGHGLVDLVNAVVLIGSARSSKQEKSAQTKLVGPAVFCSHLCVPP